MAGVRVNDHYNSDGIDDDGELEVSLLGLAARCAAFVAATKNDEAAAICAQRAAAAFDDDERSQAATGLRSTTFFEASVVGSDEESPGRFGVACAPTPKVCGVTRSPAQWCRHHRRAAPPPPRRSPVDHQPVSAMASANASAS